MNIAVKYFAIVVVLAFAGAQIADIVREFSDTRIITVTKKVPNTQTLELKGYHITKDHFEKADVSVQPNSFSDYLLLTSYKGNLLSILLKIGAWFCVAWYAFKLEPHNLLSIRQYSALRLAFILYLFSVFAYNSGIQHTSEFWNYTYWHDKSGPVTHTGFFVIDDAHPSYFFVVLAFICLFYQYFGGYANKANTTV